MTTTELASLMEEHWSDLQRELGNDWVGFLRDYKEIVKPLDQMPDREKLELTATALIDLLCQHDYARELLRPYFNRNDCTISRVAKSGSKTLGDEEQMDIAANKFLSLPKKKKSEPKMKESDEEAKKAKGK